MTKVTVKRQNGTIETVDATRVIPSNAPGLIKRFIEANAEKGNEILKIEGEELIIDDSEAKRYIKNVNDGGEGYVPERLYKSEVKKVVWYEKAEETELVKEIKEDWIKEHGYTVKAVLGGLEDGEVCGDLEDQGYTQDDIEKAYHYFMDYEVIDENQTA